MLHILFFFAILFVIYNYFENYAVSLFKVMQHGNNVYTYHILYAKNEVQDPDF